jgi:MFS family permease
MAREIRPRLDPFPALRHRNFRLFFYGYIVSLVGVWMERVASSWLVLDLTNSAFYVGLVSALGSLPVLLFALYAGAIADRVSKRRMVMVTQTLAMLISFALAGLVFSKTVTIEWVIILAALLGVSTAFDIPARQSFFVELVGKEDLINAIALNSSAFNGSRVVGPALAGIAIGAIGLGACFLFNAISFLAVIWALAIMHLPAFQKPTTRPRTWANIRIGLRYVREEGRVLRLMLNIAAVSIFGLPAIVLLPVLAKNVLGKGATEFGWMMSAIGIGAVAGALWLATFARALPRGKLLSWSAVLFGLLVIVTGIVRPFGWVLLTLALLGAAMIVTTALTNTLIQTITPDELRGRVVSVYSLAFVGMGPIGSLLFGGIAQRLGTPTALEIGGGITVLAAMILVWRGRELRETR